MRRYLATRVAGLLLVILAATAVVFFALSLIPGDPAELMLGMYATPEGIARLRHDLGLDQPLWKQYADFLGGLLHGDLGLSYQHEQQQVSAEIARAFPVTLELASAALVLAVVFGLTIGVVCAVKANTWIDHVLRVTVLAATSVPIYVSGLVLIYVFSVNGPHMPSFGWGTASHLILPSFALASYPLALIGRLTRTAMLDEIGADYVNTARAKGLAERVVVVRHVMRNAMIPVVTVVGLQFGAMLAGAVLTESIFSIPGLGLLLVNAVLARDYAMIRGAVLVAAVAIALVNLGVDLIYVLIDPRIRLA
jgi:peptide/nickel transport system permease protein